MPEQVFPAAKIDGVALTLFAIAVLPWLGTIFKGVELPGGLKVEYRDLEKVKEDADKVGLLTAPQQKEAEPAEKRCHHIS